jgi:hypothetical protein
MNTDAWLEAACGDADRRGLPELKPLLTSLAATMRAIRAADWNDAAEGSPAPSATGNAATGGQPPGEASPAGPAENGGGR